MTVIALRVAHPQRQRPVCDLELFQIRIVSPEQAVEERHARLDASLLVRPHPLAVELGPYRLRGDNRAAAAVLGELPDHDLRGLWIDPEQNRIGGLINTPLRLFVPEWIRKLPGRQQVAEPGPQTDQVQSLALDVFGAVLAVVHE